MTAIDLSKQQAPNADPTAIQQINFTRNLDHAGETRMFFILNKANETICFTRNCKSFTNVFYLIWY